jgi:hypothetical protein
MRVILDPPQERFQILRRALISMRTRPRRCGLISMTSIGMFRERQESRVMTLDYSFNDIEAIWIRGELPFGKTETRKVKVKLSGTTNSYFPPAMLEIGDLLCGARPSRPDYFVTLLLTYPYGTVPLNVSPAREGFWSEIHGSTIYGQIRIPLPEQAVTLLKPADGGSEYSYELTLDNVAMNNKTKRPRGDRTSNRTES